MISLMSHEHDVKDEEWRERLVMSWEMKGEKNYVKDEEWGEI